MKFILIILLILLGVTFTIMGLKYYFHMVNFKKNSVKAQGKVISIKTNFSKNGKLLYSPVILFKTENGIEITIDVQRYRFENYKIGEEIELIYDNKNPNNAKINSKELVFGGSFFLILAAVACFGIGVYLFFRK